MTSSIQGLVFDIKQKSLAIRETDKAIKRIQDILVTQSKTKDLKTEQKKELKLLAKDLLRIGNEIGDALFETDADENWIDSTVS